MNMKSLHIRPIQWPNQNVSAMATSPLKADGWKWKKSGCKHQDKYYVTCSFQTLAQFTKLTGLIFNQKKYLISSMLRKVTHDNQEEKYLSFVQ